MDNNYIYYRILGINPGATPEEIKAAYREQVKINHPDTSPGDEKKAELMKRINEAYEKLYSIPNKEAFENSLKRPSGNKSVIELKIEKDKVTRRIAEVSNEKEQYEKSIIKAKENNQKNVKLAYAEMRRESDKYSNKLYKASVKMKTSLFFAKKYKEKYEELDAYLRELNEMRLKKIATINTAYEIILEKYQDDIKACEQELRRLKIDESNLIDEINKALSKEQYPGNKSR